METIDSPNQKNDLPVNKGEFQNFENPILGEKAMFTKNFNLLIASFALFALIAIGPISTEAQSTQLNLTDNTVAWVLTAPCDQTSIGGNCVKYVRREVSPMPSTDLTTYSAKLSIINHRFPTVGSAFIQSALSPFTANGHIGVVRAVRVLSDGKLQLDIEESHYGDCTITKRYNITPESRDIQGYYDPRYFNSTAATPKINGMTNYTGTHAVPFVVAVSGAGFDSTTVEAVILGGWCNTFDRCRIGNSLVQNKSSTSLKVPVTLNSAGTYTLYLFNRSSGKTSNGQQIVVR